MTALVVLLISKSLTSQPISLSGEHYDHLIGLELADSADISDALEMDVLIGSDMYWSLVTGRITEGDNRPTAIHTKVGWVLSGPVDQQGVMVNLSLASAHTLKVDAYPDKSSLNDCLKQCWELKLINIAKEEVSVSERFM